MPPPRKSRAHTVPQEITPELALVSSEIGEAARAQLPDRPWSQGAEDVRPSPSDGGYGPPIAASRRVRRRVIALGALAAVTLVAGSALASVLMRDETAVVAPPPSPMSTASEAPDAGSALLVPQGGYVVTPRGSLTTSAAGREIATFILPVRCDFGTLEARDIPVVNGSFAYTGTAGKGIEVRITGRVLPSGELDGVVAVEADSCSPRRVAFTARLS